MASNIDHCGIVIAIDGHFVDVEMTIEAACEGCKMKAMCNKESESHRVVSVYTEAASQYKIGQSVVVSISTAIGMKAALWVYVIPFLMILTTLICSLQLGVSELLSGISSLSILVIYYFVLYLLKNRIAKEIQFQISKPL